LFSGKYIACSFFELKKEIFNNNVRNVGNKYSELDDKILRTVVEVDGGY